MESPLIQRDKELNKKEGYTMNPDEQRQKSLIFERIIHARNQREQSRDEFDGLNYEQAYPSNKRAAMSYLTPKKNDDEVRVNTGTTEKRIELVMNELLALNVEGEVRAYDQEDNLMQDVGEVFTDLVKRTRQMEQAEDKNIYFYKELLTQPCLFVEELWIENEKKKGKKSLTNRGHCERRMLQGPQIYLGDVNLPDIRFNEQPYLIKYARMSYEEGERTLKPLNPERWDSVQMGAYHSVGSPNYKIYRDGSLQQNEIEAFWYMSYPDDEVQLYVQGVPFMEVGSKYTDEYGDLGGYHITMVGLNPYGYDFAYSKPLTQSAKTLQALDNETIRNLIRKFRQAIEPPTGTPKGRVFSRDIWNAGALVQGVKAEDFSKLIDHQGVTQSEMAMFDLIEKKTNEFIGTSQSEPLQGKSKVTATELVLAQKNAIKLLGNSVLAVTRLNDRLDMLRIKNILNNYTKPTGRKIDPVSGKLREIYAKFTLQDAELGGMQGTKIIQMTDEPVSREEQLSRFAEEERGKEAGNPIQYKYLNIPALKDLDLYFYVTSSAKPQQSSELDKTLLTETLNQAVAISQITGRPVNSGKLIERFERIYKERDMFEKQPPMQTGIASPQGLQPEQQAMQATSQARQINRAAMQGDKTNPFAQIPELSQIPNA